MRHKRCILLWLLIVSISMEALSFAQSARNVLGDVTSEKSGDALDIHFEFKRPVSEFAKPRFLEKSVQMDLPNAVVVPSRRFFYTGDSRIPQIAVTQVNSRTVRVQFVLGEKLPGLSERFHLEKQGTTLTVRLGGGETAVLDRLLARAAEKLDVPAKPALQKASAAPARKSPPARPAVLQTIEKKPALPVSAASNPVPAANELKPEIPLRSESSTVLDPVPTTLRMLGTLSLVLGIMFLVFFVFKKFVLKNTLFGGNEKLVRVLGTGFLGPKKNIALVEIAGEILVLGISNDHISLLSNIREEERIEQIRAFGDKRNRTRPGNEAPEESREALPGTEQAKQAFAKYLDQFSPSQKRSRKERSVDEVTEKIRQNLGRLRTL